MSGHPVTVAQVRGYVRNSECRRWLRVESHCKRYQWGAVSHRTPDEAVRPETGAFPGITVRHPIWVMLPSLTHANVRAW
jgi:hypothetical protein